MTVDLHRVTDWLTDWLTDWRNGRVILEKSIVIGPVNKFQNTYADKKFITVVGIARHSIVTDSRLQYLTFRRLMSTIVDVPHR